MLTRLSAVLQVKLKGMFPGVSVTTAFRRTMGCPVNMLSCTAHLVLLHDKRDNKRNNTTCHAEPAQSNYHI